MLDLGDSAAGGRLTLSSSADSATHWRQLVTPLEEPIADGAPPSVAWLVFDDENQLSLPTADAAPSPFGNYAPVQFSSVQPWCQQCQ